MVIWEMVGGMGKGKVVFIIRIFEIDGVLIRELLHVDAIVLLRSLVFTLQTV
jgi:hypothetical protein